MKKSFAKYIALFLAATMAFGAVGCGKDEEVQQKESAVVKEEDTTAKENTADGEEKQTEGEASADEEQQQEGGEAANAGKDTSAYQLKDAYVTAENAPELVAPAAILIERSTGTILYEKNAEQKMYPASMTKVVTALVALDYFEPEELIKVGTEINEISLDSSKAGHQVGETLTMENAIRGLIIPSGNDSANVVAAAVARRAENDENMSFSRCEAVFTDLMNKKAEELGAVNTHFSNAHGYHADDHYTTAKDMVLFSKAFMENATLAKIANEKGFSGNGANNMFAESAEMKTQDYVWRSHNLLITDNEYNYGYAKGIKTGFTDQAGDCVTAAAEKDGTNLVAVVFHSEDPNRWLDSKNLFEYGFHEYQKVELAKVNETVEEVSLVKHKKKEGDTLAVVYQEPLVTYLPASAADTVKTTVTYHDTYAVEDKEGKISLKAPIAKGTEVGKVSYEINGKQVLETTVVAGRDVSKGNIFSTIGYFLKDLFSNIFSLKGLIVIGVILAVCVVAFVVIRMLGNRRYRSRGGYTFHSTGRIGMNTGRKTRRRRGGRRRF